MRDIILVRHGVPETEGKLFLGTTDPPLSEEGKRQARRLSAEYGDKEIRCIITSPLLRCRQTADILSGGRIPVVVEPALHEISMGAWDGKSFDSIREQFPEEFRMRGEDIADYAVPGGESFRQCQERVTEAFLRIRREYDGNLVLVTHAGVIRCIRSFLEHRDLSRLLELPVPYGEAFRTEDEVYDGLITAAGRSSRMGDFKPLMEVEGRKVILRILDRFREAGVRHTAVVTGRNADELESVIREEWTEEQVSFVRNADYMDTQMFDSIRMGLMALLTGYGKKRDVPGGVFLAPVDVPGFTVFTMDLEKECLKDASVRAVVPRYRGADGHPILLRQAAVSEVLDHDGTRGLKGALQKMGEELRGADTPDAGCAMDTDTPDDMDRVMKVLGNRYVFKKDSCTELLECCKIKQEIRDHCAAVSLLAGEMEEACRKAGIFLDRDILLEAASLHDIGKCRGNRSHAEYGAWMLGRLGLERLCGPVRFHTDLPRSMQDRLCESTLVYLADKLVLGTERVSPEERFGPKFRKFAADPDALAAVKRRYDSARRAADTLLRGAGDFLPMKIRNLLEQ